MGDCWFLSALAIASTTQGLIEKVCVAVGIFFFSLDSFARYWMLMAGLFYSGMNKWECTDSYFSRMIDGSTSSLTSKLFLPLSKSRVTPDANDPPPPVSYLHKYPNSKNSATAKRHYTMTTRRTTTVSRARGVRLCISPDPG